MGSMLDLTEAVDFVSSTGILFVCDFLVLGTLVFYIVWFNLNARSRFSDEDCSGREPLVQQAHYLKKDWCRGSLIFAGWHRVTQGAPLIFSLMVLVDMAYANLVSPVEITGRAVIYTAVSLIFGVSGAMFRFSVLADESRPEKWCKAVPRGSQPRPPSYAALLFLSNASSTSLSTLSTPPGSAGSGSRP